MTRYRNDPVTTHSFPREVIRDGNISYRARGIYFRLRSNSLEFSMDARALARCGPNCEGRDAVLTALVELERYGYITRFVERGADGRLSTVTRIHERSVTGSTPRSDEEMNSSPHALRAAKVQPADGTPCATGSGITGSGKSGSGDAGSGPAVPAHISSRVTKNTTTMGDIGAPNRSASTDAQAGGGGAGDLDEETWLDAVRWDAARRPPDRKIFSIPGWIAKARQRVRAAGFNDQDRDLVNEFLEHQARESLAQARRSQPKEGEDAPRRTPAPPGLIAGLKQSFTRGTVTSAPAREAKAPELRQDHTAPDEQTETR